MNSPAPESFEFSTWPNPFEAVDVLISGGSRRPSLRPEGKEAPSRPWRPALLFAFGLVLALTAACGGDGGTTEPSPQGTVEPSAAAAASAQPSGTTAAVGAWADFRQVLQRFVPESATFMAYMPRITDTDRPNVELTITPAFSAGRLHVIQFSGRGETFFGKYKDFDIYKLEQTPWAKLADGQPPLWVGSPSEDTLHAYLDFFVSGKPALTNERFWNAYGYAEARLASGLGDDVALLRVDFDDTWAGGTPTAGGIRIEATQGNRRAYVGVLYAAADSGLNGTTLVESSGEAFRQRFAVPDRASQQLQNVQWEELENSEWGYPNHIWFVQWETAS